MANRIAEGFARRVLHVADMREEVDPAHFDDPVALRTAWSPMESGGASFRTRRFVAVSGTRAEFRPTVVTLAFCLLSLVFGLGSLAMYVNERFVGPLSFVSGDSGSSSVVVGIVFTIVGAWSLRQATAPLVFDRGAGELRKGRGDRSKAGQDGNRHSGPQEGGIRLDRVHALQLVAAQRSQQGSTRYLELNLVLEDGDRVMVVRHGAWSKLQDDGRQLAHFLGKPLWDATEAPSRPITPRHAEAVRSTALSSDAHDGSAGGPADEATAIERLDAMVQEQIAPTVAAPAEMDDPIAEQTNWGHMSTAGGGNIRTHILVEVRPSRLEFRAAPQALAFYCIPLLLGVGIIFMFVDVPFFGRLISDSTTTAPPCMGIPFGLLFATAGIWLLRHGTEPIVFDIGRGQYWKGRSSRFGRSSPHDLADFIELSRIHALQLVSQRHEDRDSLWFGHEINLVLDDGARMNVLSHGDRAAIRRDAQRLAAAIDRPVWDQTRVGT